MNMRFLILPMSFLLLSACASSPVRKVASLDNNGDIHDDSFDPALETWYQGTEANEMTAVNRVADIIRNFINSQKSIRSQMMDSSIKDSDSSKRVFADLPKPDYATRDVHRKTNGCFKAEMHVSSDLKTVINNQIASYESEATNGSPRLSLVSGPEDLGIFDGGPSYDAIVRLSNGNPGNNPDKVADARGFAVKFLPKGTLSSSTISASDAEALNLATKLDILSINFPTFFVSDPVKYAKLNQGALNGASDFKNKLESTTEESAAIFLGSDLTSLERRLALWVNGSVIYSPLFQTYYSMVPSRLGPEGSIRAVKYSWEPVACSNNEAPAFAQEKNVEWASWTNDHTFAFPPRSPKQVENFPDDYLREHVVDRLQKGNFCFNLYFQLYRDSQSTNIEDSTDIWLGSSSEKTWWSDSVVPGRLIWRTDLDNTESRDQYLSRFNQKKLAPKLYAGQLVMKQLAGEDLKIGAANNKTCEDLSFNPWNGDIAHHKPLGIVSRMKRKVYNASRRERHRLNGIDDKNIERQ